MSIEATRVLKQTLLDVYGHFSDKRIKKIDSGSLFIADDRGPGDHGADGRLFGWFCLIFAEVVDQDTVSVTLRGQVPQGTDVEGWLAAHGAQLTPGGVEFSVQRGHESNLKELAKAFRAIVAPGKSYTVKSYKYSCPRTATSLERLADALGKAWKAT